MKTEWMNLALAATAALSTGCSGLPAQAREAQSKAAQKMYVYESDANGFNTKTIFYDNGEEVVAFDTQFTPELARKAIDYLRTQTSRPLTYAVITHPNPDKFNGMGERARGLGSQIVDR